MENLTENVMKRCAYNTISLDDKNQSSPFQAGGPAADISARVPAHEHPTVWAYVGKGRYLQAAFCRSTASLYAEQFEKKTIKCLSNIAARFGQLELLEWCRDMGCVWDESLYVSGAGGGSTPVMAWLSVNGCPLPSESKTVCDAAAIGGHVNALKWLHDKRLWHEHAGEAAAREAKLDALEWQLTQIEARPVYGEVRLLNGLYRGACEGGQVHVVEWLRKRDVPWNVKLCVEAAIIHERLNILKYLHAVEEGLPLDVTIAETVHNWGPRFEIVEYLHTLGCPFLATLDLAAQLGGTFTRTLKHAVARGNRKHLDQVSTCTHAALLGSISMLQWLRSEGCPWDGDTLKVARLFSNESPRHRIIEQWAMENGCLEPNS